MSRRPKNNKKNRTTAQPPAPVPPVAQNTRLAEAVQLFEDENNPLATIDDAQEAIRIATDVSLPVSVVGSVETQPVTPSPLVTKPSVTTQTVHEPIHDDSEWNDFGDSVFDEETEFVTGPAAEAALDEVVINAASEIHGEIVEVSDSTSFDDGQHDTKCVETTQPEADEPDRLNEAAMPPDPRRGLTIQPQVDTQQLAEAVGHQIAALAEALRTELRTSICELQASQAAAASAQSEVLKTLSEIIFQTAAAREPSGDAIERAVAGMEDRLFARLSFAGVSASAAELAQASGNGAASEMGKEKHAGFAARLPKPSQNAVRSWDEIRTELMSHSDLSDASVSIHSSAASRMAEGDSSMSSAAFAEATQLTSDRHFRLPEQDPLLEVPEAVNPESLDEAQLREAFNEREAFISTLIARIRRQHENMTGLLSADQLRTLQTEMPEDLENLIRVTLRRMDDLARMGELEMALERARIARQLNQLQHSRQIIEHNARQLGMTLNPDGSISSSGGPQRTSNSRRWLGKLGFGQ